MAVNLHKLKIKVKEFCGASGLIPVQGWGHYEHEFGVKVTCRYCNREHKEILCRGRCVMGSGAPYNLLIQCPCGLMDKLTVDDHYMAEEPTEISQTDSWMTVMTVVKECDHLMQLNEDVKLKHIEWNCKITTNDGEVVTKKFKLRKGSYGTEDDEDFSITGVVAKFEHSECLDKRDPVST